MTFEIHSTREVSARQGVKSLVYGQAGVGKTRLCGTAPYPIIISAEGGLLSLRDQNLPYITITSLIELQNVYSWLQRRDQSSLQFHTVAIDSISELAEVCLKAELKKSKDGRMAYGAMGTIMTQVVKDFRDLPMRHVIVTAKEEHSKNDMSGLLYFHPSLPGSKLGAGLPYLFDEVFHMVRVMDPNTRKSNEWLRTTADASVIAKDRSGALAEWEAPNLSAIFAKIAG